jgi:hypothetical protein
LARNEKTDEAAAREQRLAAALRQNLRKRKLQQVRRQQAEDGEKADPQAAGGATGGKREP